MSSLKPSKVRREDADPDPFMIKISRKNGEVNRMKISSLRKKLFDNHLSPDGVDKVLQRRLKNYYKRQLYAESQRQLSQPTLDYIVVIDFEATTEETKGNDYPHEIIEFPIVLIDVKSATVAGEFHEYVKPVLNPKLSKFCRTLTGISQKRIDVADEFPQVFSRAVKFLEERVFGTRWAILTDGPWDMSRFLYKQCSISRLPFPKWARKWINVRKVHANYYAVGKPKKIILMLEDLGKEFDGSLHSGIDDTRNIARIALSLLEDGCDIVTNEKLLEPIEYDGHCIGADFRRQLSDDFQRPKETNSKNTMEIDHDTLSSLHSQIQGLEISKDKKRVRRKEVAPENNDDDEDTEISNNRAKDLSMKYRSEGNNDKDKQGKYCRVWLLDDTEVRFNVKPNHKGQSVLSKVFKHLNLVEKEYFGLRFIDNTNQAQWLDTSRGLGSQFKGPPPYTFYFGVKFYAVDPCKLKQEITRYQFFLQVKKDIFQGRLPVTFEMAAECSALAVQSELGDFDPARHTQGYVSEFRFVPNQTEQLEARIAYLHKFLVGKIPEVAECKFLDKVKWLEMYGVDMHHVIGDNKVDYLLGLTPTGIVVYKNKQKVGNYYWPRISKISHRNTKFILKVRDKNNDENTQTYDLNTKSACKYLYRCSVDHHAFFRLTRRVDLVNSTKASNSKRSSRRDNNDPQKDRSPSLTRTEPNFVRTPSKRHRRRRSDGAMTDFLTSSAPNINEMSRSLKNSGPSAGRMANGQAGDVMYLSDLPDSPRSGRSMKSARSWSEATQRRIAGAWPMRKDRSLQSIQSEPAGAQRNRRNRQRSRSPGRKPPEELAQHFRYVEMDTDVANLTEEQKQKMMDIPYIEVKTTRPAPRVNNRTRQRYRSPMRSERRECDRESVKSGGRLYPPTVVHNNIPVEPPPPYSPPHSDQRYSCPPAYFPPIPPPPIMARPELEGAIHPQPRLPRDFSNRPHSRIPKSTGYAEQVSSNYQARHSRSRQRTTTPLSRSTRSSLTTQI
ncbi:DgyrCDS7014 [Dimorphilus gyrociliatus]|uniref:DgyrCDS7014 n=1 Tax=Dimorphilus gyrociliatus TaxID=2664684 RepID=A0A7I8VQE3_9ANNE|nr:DgyrCDS7014 [Dimorphilus gyrociliatus]